MKIAANIIAILAWGSALATLWVGLLAETRPPLAPLVGALVLSFLVGLVVPSYLLNLENRSRALSPTELPRRIASAVTRTDAASPESGLN